MKPRRKNISAVSVRLAFDEAIRSAGREGVLSMQALANERAGVFFIGVDQMWASTYLTRAHELHYQWGASGKSRHMQGEYGSLLQPSKRTDSNSTSGLRARERISDYMSLSKEQILVMEGY